MQKPLRQSSGYLPSLDGWRALAILAVMMFHDQYWTFRGYSNYRIWDYGGWGVYLFFAISGLLITTRILEEESLLGRFRLKSFYIRRLLRIQPAAIFYLMVIGVLMLCGILRGLWKSWFGALFLYQNFIHHELNQNALALDVFTGHYWTLAVEEHFYILLSLLLYFVRQYRIAVLGGIVLFTVLAQKIIIAHHGFNEDVSERRTYWVIQYLLVPSWLALLLRVGSIRAFAHKFLLPWVAFTGTAAYLLAIRLAHPIPGAPLWSLQYIALERLPIIFSFSLWIIATMLHGRSWTTQALETPPMRYVGRLSYSLYLWHILFFIPSRYPQMVSSPVLSFLSHSPWRYAMTAVMAMLSYYFVEKPLIRLGHRLAPPSTPGHEDLRVEVEPEAMAA